MSALKSSSAEVVIVGGGPAGLSCARSLKAAGVKDIVILEREAEAGGIPRHCGHSGYGLREFTRLMQGPDYARRLVDEVDGLDLRLKTTVLGLRPGGELLVTGPNGPQSLTGNKVLLAMGARETPRSARLLTGTRPQGVMNTGMLQQMIYLQGRKPFRNPVVIGSELVSFSTLLTLRHIGVKPAAMIESNDRITARWPGDLLARHLFGVPVMLNTKLVRILGIERVEGIEIERNGAIERIDCDGVILTGRFRPETALVVPSALAVDAGSHGPCIDQNMRCSDASYFAAGNLLRGIETAGQCFREGAAVAGHILAALRTPTLAPQRLIPVSAAGPLAYVYPQCIDPALDTDRPLLFKARVMHAVRGRLSVSVDGQTVWSRSIDALPERRIGWHLPATSLGKAERIDVTIAGD
ncbi:MAG TPA: FAD/NAD(P)-binding oxidoreductase [Terriglobales bacterium]|nr:FAD/NAD(P)-binding oxidoreductase [Terriglobales bacterium]